MQKLKPYFRSIPLVFFLISTCTNPDPKVPLSPQKTSTSSSYIHPEKWPKQTSPFIPDRSLDEFVQTILKQMSLQQKVGQIIQADIASVTPKEAAQYHLGAILNGGNSAPNGNVRCAPEAWLELADQYWDAVMTQPKPMLRVPLLWGTDAVHGHSNIVGATIFPHNIGLGATHNSELIHKIGQVTAREIRVTGQDWTFAPTLAVTRDDRWGRTYESYSESPNQVAEFARAFIAGLQGPVGSKNFLGPQHVLATAKHFLGDGGTFLGKDRGDNRATETELMNIHAAGYYPALKSGVLVVMASFNAYHGQKLHGHHDLLTNILVKRMGFEGFVIGDWNGHEQVEGCSADSCPQALAAGLDMFMAPNSWKALYKNTLQQVKNGHISIQRLDAAVSRILRVKAQLGLFTAKRPSERPLAGNLDVLADRTHKQLARQAVRESLVLLKNNDATLPIRPDAKVLVVGQAAQNIDLLCGGWTYTWQGTGNTNKHFPHGQSIYKGLKDAIEAGGGQIEMSLNGEYTQLPDVAVVVFGEPAYAEYAGDRSHLDYEPVAPLNILRTLKASGIKTVSIFISGRPLWTNPEINASDAFVAAWLPGDQGAGVADVLVDHPKNAYDFSGTLPFSWPKVATGIPLNPDAPNYTPQFAYGYGLSYATPRVVKQLPEESGLDRPQTQRLVLIKQGNIRSQWRLYLSDPQGAIHANSANVSSPSQAVTARAIDDRAQEDVRRFSWHSSGQLRLSGPPTDLSTLYKRNAYLKLKYRVSGKNVGLTTLGIACGKTAACAQVVPLNPTFKHALNLPDWQELKISLKCLLTDTSLLSAVRVPLVITSEGPLTLDISSVEMTTPRPNELPTSCKRHL